MTCQSTLAPWQFRGLVPSLDIGNVSIGPMIDMFFEFSMFELIGLDFFHSLEKHLKIGIATDFLGIIFDIGNFGLC